MKRLISISNKKPKRGFTLVEVVVVLIIIAILAAILFPSLTGYIDKAREKAIVSEARQFMQSFQVALSETYAFKTIDSSIKYKDADFPGVKVGKITNFTFNNIKRKGSISPQAAFDQTMAKIAYDLVGGGDNDYITQNSSGKTVTTDGKVLFQLTYDSNALILKFEYGKDGVYVLFKDGEYTCKINGKFSSYTE